LVTQSDPELAADFAAGKRSALADAYRRYGRLLYTVARNTLGNDSAAEDCVHDALLRVWRTRGAYRPERGVLRAFLVTCVRNEAMSMLRSAMRRSSREERAERLEPAREAVFDVPDHVEVQRLRDAMARLPEEQRKALELAYYGNRTQSEVATELSVPLGTVKSRLSTAMRRLADELRVPQEKGA
jgi:RNA polymerase sigma-70 factor (ECF subfamily)